jgi:hypothetical protein
MPTIGRDEEPLAAAEREAVIDPQCPVAKRLAQSQQSRHLEGTECSFAVRSRTECIPRERVGLNERGAGSWRTSPDIEMTKSC